MGIHFFENYNETIYNDIISSLLANHCKSNNISFYLITENRDNQSLKRAYPKQVKRIELGAPEHEMQYLDKIFQVGIR